MATIHEQLQTYRTELAEATSKGDQAIARKLEQRIQELEEYQQRHPETAEAHGIHQAQRLLATVGGLAQLPAKAVQGSVPSVFSVQT